MAFFEQHPPHIRKKIALAITGGVALILLVLMIIIYTTKKTSETNDSGSKLEHFYTTILKNGQSYFGGN